MCVCGQVHGRHVAVIRTVSGAYVTEYGETDDIASARKSVEVNAPTRVPSSSEVLFDCRSLKSKRVEDLVS